MSGFPNTAERALAQLPQKQTTPFGARGLEGLRAMIPQVEAMGYPQAQPAPAPTAASRMAGGVSPAVLSHYDRVQQIPAGAPAPSGFGSRGLEGLRAAIPQVEAMGYPQQAPVPTRSVAESRMAGGVPREVLQHYDRVNQIPGYADGGLIGRLKQMVGMDEERNARIATYKAQQAQERAQAASAAQPAASAPVKAITDYSGAGATQRREKAIGFAGGGMIRGPGTGTSDSIEAEAEPGTFIMPADSTEAIGPDALEQMGTVPVRLSDGEYSLPPEQVMAIGEAVLKLLKDATHTPVNGIDGGQTAEQLEPGFKEGGMIQAMVYPPATDYDDIDEPMPDEVPLYADGGLVDDVTRRMNQIPTGGMPAPRADGSQSNPLNTDLGRNAVNTLSALPGVTGLAGRVGAPAARAAVPAVAEAVEATPLAARAAPQLSNASGPLSRAANLAPTPALPAPAGQLATTGGRAVGPANPGQAARAPLEFVERVPDAALTMSQTAAPVGLAARAGGNALSTYAPAAAGLGAVSLMAGASPDAAPAQPQAAGFAPGALAAQALQQPPAQAQPAAQSSAPPAGGVTRTGNSYTGPANISGDVTINGAAPGGGSISPQNMAAADNLAARQAQESAARVMGSMPAGFPAAQAPTVLTTDNSWQARNNMRNAQVSAESITNNGGRWDTTGGRNPAQAAYQAEIANDAAARAAAPRLAGQAMQETGANNRAVLQQAGETQRANINAGAQTQRAQIAATAAANKPPEGYRRTAAGNLEAIPGGPADQRNNQDARQQTKDTQDIFSILNQARPLLADATGSYLGAGVDKAASAVGVTTTGAERTAQLKALQGSLISKMPKMSGPQSDKDVQLYREMAGQIGDSTIPTAQREAAMNTIESLNVKYLPSPADQTAYNAIPQGSFYKTPSGEVRRKN